MQINIEKGNIFIILTAIVLVAGIIIVASYTQPIPNPGHGADTIWISNSSGAEKTLQQSIESGDFKGPKGDTGPQGIQGIQGIQGPQGIQGAPSPPINTTAVCTSGSYQCSCIIKYISKVVGQCTVTSDTGSCSGSNSCCVCSPIA